MEPQLVGHPDRLEPFLTFIGVIARTSDPVLVTGPVGSGKKRIVRHLIDRSAFQQDPIFFLDCLQFSEGLWAQALSSVQPRGTLVLEGLHYLSLPIQSQLKDWLAGKGPLSSERQALPSGIRLLATSTRPDSVWEELIYDFPYLLQLPSLIEVIEDIPYHIKSFLREKPVRYIRYFFLLKTFYHQWQGNLRELEHYLFQAMAYYHSAAMKPVSKGSEEVFGEKRLRYYQDVLKGEWWYYPYRFRSGFVEAFGEILNQTDFRSEIIKEDWVIPLLREEPGFLVLDLKDSEFETKAIRIYHTFQKYLNQGVARTSGG